MTDPNESAPKRHMTTDFPDGIGIRRRPHLIDRAGENDRPGDSFDFTRGDWTASHAGEEIGSSGTSDPDPVAGE